MPFGNLTYTKNSLIKFGGFITGVIAAVTSLISPYFSSLYLAPIAVLRAPIFINNANRYMLWILSFLPSSYIAIITPNLTPFMVAAITISVPLFISALLFLPFIYRLGTIPGEAAVVGIIPVIEGLFKGVCASFAHIFARLSEELKGKQTINAPREDQDNVAIAVIHHSNDDDNNDAPGQGGCLRGSLNWIYDMFRRRNIQCQPVVLAQQNIQPSAPPMHANHNLPQNMALLGIQVVEATIAPNLYPRVGTNL